MTDLHQDQQRKTAWAVLPFSKKFNVFAACFIGLIFFFELFFFDYPSPGSLLGYFLVVAANVACIFSRNYLGYPLILVGSITLIYTSIFDRWWLSFEDDLKITCRPTIEALKRSTVDCPEANNLVIKPGQQLILSYDLSHLDGDYRDLQDSLNRKNSI